MEDRRKIPDPYLACFSRPQLIFPISLEISQYYYLVCFNEAGAASSKRSSPTLNDLLETENGPRKG